MRKRHYPPNCRVHLLDFIKQTCKCAKFSEHIGIPWHKLPPTHHEQANTVTETYLHFLQDDALSVRCTTEGIGLPPRPHVGFLVVFISPSLLSAMIHVLSRRANTTGLTWNIDGAGYHLCLRRTTQKSIHHSFNWITRKGKLLLHLMTNAVIVRWKWISFTPREKHVCAMADTYACTYKFQLLREYIF